MVSKTPCIIHVSDLWKIRNLLPGMCLLFPIHPEICCYFVPVLLELHGLAMCAHLLV